MKTADSAGLRLSEAARLRPEHLDVAYGLISAVQGKACWQRNDPGGNRLAVASGVLQVVQTARLVVRGGRDGCHLTARSVQKFVGAERLRARISKHVTPHSPRRSSATHLPVGGTALRYARELLGHKRPETTKRYSRVMRKDLRRIRSPIGTILMAAAASGPSTPYSLFLPPLLRLRCGGPRYPGRRQAGDPRSGRGSCGRRRGSTIGRVYDTRFKILRGLSKRSNIYSVTTR